MYAKYSLPGSDHEYNPFHSNNISATIGGPIIPGKQFFFFVAVEPLRSSASTGNQVLTFPDPQFAAWAQANYPNTFGTKILNSYTPSNATVSGVTKTAAGRLPGHLRNPGDEQPALLHRDDRQRGVQLEQLPERHAVLRPHRQGLQQGPDLRQLLPNHARLRRTGRDSPVLDHEPQHAECRPGELDAHLQSPHVERAHLRPEPHRRLPRRDG